jgi:3-oxoacyl-[acyl-carrier-protein] synthase-3
MKFKGPIFAAVAGTGMYVPDKILTNFDLEKMLDTSNEWIVERTGIKQRHILEEGKASSDMGLEAAKKALQKAEMTPGDIDLIIVTTYTPDYTFPTTACLIQDRLGCPKIPAYDLGAACSGFVFALSTAAQFIVTGAYRNILVIGTDASSRVVNWEDRNTCVLFGDAAAAFVLKPASISDPLLKLKAFHMGCDGAGAEYLYQPAGGSLLPTSQETVEKKLHSIFMNGR